MIRTSSFAFDNGVASAVLGVRLSREPRDLVLSKLFAELIAFMFSWLEEVCLCVLCELPGLLFVVGTGGVCEG